MFDCKLILASSSVIRSQLLRNAGVKFEMISPSVDEDKIRRECAQIALTPEKTAEKIALEKAKSVAKKTSGEGVPILGIDQILVHQGKVLSKAPNLAELRKKLIRLRGEVHNLISAAAIIGYGTEPIFIVDSARLEMRNFSDDFLEEYLVKCGDQAIKSVGGYQLETEGIQLFEKIEGDYFTILGLPLLSLLKQLRGSS